MADIHEELLKFKNAMYGEEVRGALISSIEKINEDAQKVIQIVPVTNPNDATEVGVIYRHNTSIILVAREQPGTTAGNGIQFRFRWAGSRTDKGFIESRVFHYKRNTPQFDSEWTDITYKIDIDDDDFSNLVRQTVTQVSESAIRESVSDTFNESIEVPINDQMLPVNQEIGDDIKVPSITYLKQAFKERFINVLDYGVKLFVDVSDDAEIELRDFEYRKKNMSQKALYQIALNNTIILQELINTKKYIYMPAGEYRLAALNKINEIDGTYVLEDYRTDPILNISSSACLTGDGPNATTIVGYSACNSGYYDRKYDKWHQKAPVINVSGTDLTGVIIDGLSIRGIKNILSLTDTSLEEDKKSTYASVITINSATNTVLNNLRLENGGHYGLRLTTKALDSSVSNCYFTGNLESGLYNTGYGTRVSNIISTANKVSKISDNNIGCGLITRTPILLTNSKFYLNDSDGILLQGAKGCSITNINSQQNGRHGICLVNEYDEKTLELVRPCSGNTIINVVAVANNWTSATDYTESSDIRKTILSTKNGCGIVISGRDNYIQGVDIIAQESFNAKWSSVEECSVFIASPNSLNNIIDVQVKHGFNGSNLYDTYFNNRSEVFKYPRYAYIKSIPPIEMNSITINGKKIEPSETEFIDLLTSESSVYTDVTDFQTPSNSNDTSYDDRHMTNTHMEFSITYDPDTISTLDTGSENTKPWDDGQKISSDLLNYQIANYYMYDDTILTGSGNEWYWRQDPVSVTGFKSIGGIKGAIYKSKFYNLLSKWFVQQRLLIPISASEDNGNITLIGKVYKYMSARQMNDSTATGSVRPMFHRSYTLTNPSENACRLFLQLKLRIGYTASNFKDWLIIPTLTMRSYARSISNVSENGEITFTTGSNQSTPVGEKAARPVNGYLLDVKNNLFFENGEVFKNIVFDFSGFRKNEAIDSIIPDNMKPGNIENDSICLALNVFKVTDKVTSIESEGSEVYADDISIEIMDLKYCWGDGALYKYENAIVYNTLPEHGYSIVNVTPSSDDSNTTEPEVKVNF